MNLETQVCLLELSKKLKELGVKQESLWWWDTVAKIPQLKLNPDDDWLAKETGGELQLNYYISAFTVAELGEMLPDEIDIGEMNYGLECFKIGKEWIVGYYNHDVDIHKEEASTEANARAKMLVYLKEKGLA